jgi:hypothetical protein
MRYNSFPDWVGKHHFELVSRKVTEGGGSLWPLKICDDKWMDVITLCHGFEWMGDNLNSGLWDPMPRGYNPVEVLKGYKPTSDGMQFVNFKPTKTEEIKEKANGKAIFRKSTLRAHTFVISGTG